MLRETSAASTIAASTGTGALAAPARGASPTMNERATAAQSARLIRRQLRIKASFARPEASIGRRRTDGKRSARSHLDLKDRVKLASLPLPTRTARLEFARRNARGNPNQGRSEKVRRPPGGASAPHFAMGLRPYGASLIWVSSRA